MSGFPSFTWAQVSAPPPDPPSPPKNNTFISIISLGSSVHDITHTFGAPNGESVHLGGQTATGRDQKQVETTSH